MSEKMTKDELVDEAQDLGISTTGLTKPEIVEKLESHGTGAMGPYVLAGSSGVEPFKQVSAGPGVQPLTEDDIPNRST